MLIDTVNKIKEITTIVPELKKSFSELTISHVKKDFEKILEHIKTIKQYNFTDENLYRTVYQIFNYFIDDYIENGKKTLFSYNPNLVQEAETIIKNNFTNLEKLNDDGSTKFGVIITTTTCKRTDLLEKTVNSFLECCIDWRQYVIKWIIVDDNSTEEDRKWMKEKYPFIEYIYKDTSQKGHPRSMNIIYNELISLKLSNELFLFNLEDDWDFFIKDNYIEKMIKVLKSNNNYGQCLVNNNYSEDTKTGSQIWGSTMKYIDSLRYFVHNHYTGKQLDEINNLKKYPNCFYWPHFSFRPGLTKLKVLQDIGSFNESAQHFEMEYAYRYVKKGYLTTFLDSVSSSHIGRRTYERQTDKLNAYDLNNEQQFGSKPKTVKDEAPENIHKEDTSIKQVNLNQTSKISLVSYVITLERRRDRLIQFFQMNKDEMIPIKVLKGFDGKKMNPSHKIQKAFKTGDYNYRKGIIGCAMSHIHIWKEFLNNPSYTNCLVLEDDAKLVKNFSDKLMKTLIKYDGQYEIMFLHYNPYPQYMKKELFFEYQDIKAEEWSIERSRRENMGSTAGYVLSREGARNLLRYVEKCGCPNAIDWVMFKSPTLQDYRQRILYTTPLLVHANCFQSAQGTVDTDIQNVYESLSYSTNDEWDKEEYKYILNKIKDRPEGAKKLINFVKSVKNEKVDLFNTKVCIFGIEELEEYKEKCRTTLSEYYTTNTKVYSIPHSLLDEEFYKDKVWGDVYLNTLKPF